MFTFNTAADREILREIRDLLRIQLQGLKDMASTVADMKAALAWVNDQATALLAQQDALKTALDTAVADLGVAVSSGQASIIDTVTTAMTTLSGHLATAKTNNDAMQTEIAAALAAVPPPAS